MLEILDNPAETFQGSLSGIARLRDDINVQFQKMTKPKPVSKLVSCDSWIQIEDNGEVLE